MPTGHYDRSKVDYGSGVCPCGRKFKKEHNSQKFCRMDCKARTTRGRRNGTRICRRCDVEFKPVGKTSGRIYCQSCDEIVQVEWQEQQGRRAKRPRNLGRECAHCGRTFIADRGQQKYCTNDCKTKARVQRERTQGVGKPSRVKCATCGKAFQQSRVYQKYCSKECWRGNPETRQRARNKQFWYDYGIDLDVLSAWLKLQGNKCEVCRKQLRVKELGIEGTKSAIDHDHDTGEVRGVLCHNCNIALGSAKDDPEVLRKLARYLENAKSTRRQDAIRSAQEGDVSRLEAGRFPHLWRD